jgi:uncharacterized protein (TIGR02996 family)
MQEAFWQAIREAPEDDAPRLVYADWLDEQGVADLSARAEFIRLQCELERLPEDAKERQAELKQREEVLWKKYRKAWLAPLRPFSHKIEFRRGFPDQVLVHGKTFVEHAEEVMSAAPVFSIRLRNSKEQITELAQCSALTRLVSLSLYWNHIGLRRAKVFFESPHLHQLRELDLNDNQIQPEGVRALTQANLARLRSLNLRANKIVDAGLRILAESPLLGQLDTLGLVHNELTDAGVAALAASTHAAGLTSLDLAQHIGIGDAGACAIAGSPHLSRLTTLSLGVGGLANDTGYCDAAVRRRTIGVTEVGARALASSPSLAGLIDLDLSGHTLLGDAGLRALAEATAMRRLKNLRLSWCSIQGPGLRALGEAPFAQELALLDLNGNGVEDEGAEVIASTPLPGLRKLFLRFSRIRDRGAAALAASPFLEGLSCLDLWQNRSISEAGKKALRARFGERVVGLR